MSQPQRILRRIEVASEPMSWQAICDRYPEQWVCLVDIDNVNASDSEFCTARVIGHGRTLRAAVEEARALSVADDQLSYYFTGRPGAVPRSF